MRIGLLGARADNRGLAIQTAAFARHMRPAKVLGVVDPRSPYENDWRTYSPDNLKVVAMEDLSDDVIFDFLDGLDAFYCAETPYRNEAFKFAREAGVRSVCHCNFDFFRWHVDPSIPRPDLFLMPSTWHWDDVPEPKALLPFPVDRGVLPFRRRERADTFLHVAGHRAMLDRNGTGLVTGALRFVRSRVRVIIRSQDPVRGIRMVPRNVKLEVVLDNVPNYWELYGEGDVFLFPRRYGGLCLPINEAASAGMPVVSLDVEPQRRFLPEEALVPAVGAKKFKAHSSHLTRWNARVQDVARKIDELHRDRHLVQRLSDASDRYADSISWEALGPRLLEALAP